MKKLIILVLTLAAGLPLSAQMQRATMLENYQIAVENVLDAEPPLTFRDESFQQMPGFPVGRLANENYKNLRNVTLVDLNRDGADDIIWGANNRLFAHSYQGLLWQRILSGLVIYPASVADLDKDGSLEIVQATGGSQTESRLYMLDAEGKDKGGWPLSFDGNWILTAPALADVDDNGEMEVIFNQRAMPNGKLHIVKPNGQSFNSNWPASVSGTLALTPSIGDVDQDGEKDIYVATTTARYLFGLNGQPKNGWPQMTDPAQRYSFQSPLLVDLNNDGKLEIIGASHGNSPEYYVLQADGSFSPSWPKPVPNNSWTFSTPTVVSIEGEYKVFMSRPISENTNDMLYAWDAAGRSLPGFPLFKSGGLEGFVSMADVDNDQEFELVFGSNLLLPDGRSFIHAYEMDGVTEVPGFPIRPYGWTFMNGVNIGDVNGDGQMDLAALSYTQNFGNGLDSVFLNVYELKVPYQPERVLWGTYKGNNTRDGLLTPGNITPVSEKGPTLRHQLAVYPNPVKDVLNVQLALARPGRLHLDLLNAQGLSFDRLEQNIINSGTQQFSLPVNHLPPGLYFIIVRLDENLLQTLKFVKQ